MATRLSLYRAALLAVGERDIASLDEDREPRHLLDRAWDDGAVDYCLGRGQWHFAARTRQLTSDTSIEPAFGYTKAFGIPSDLIRTVGIWSDEYCNTPLTAYTLEHGYWFADLEPIYVRYVSNDSSYGGDLSTWPKDFSRAVSLYLASQIVLKLTQSEDREQDLTKRADRAFLEAASSDAMEGPTKFLPVSSWVRSRVVTGAGRGDRGNRSKLTG